MKEKVKPYLLPIIICAVLTAIDQLVKHIITGSMVLYESRPVIKGVFEITYIRNTGSAWSLFAGKTGFLLVMTVVTLLVLFYVYYNVQGPKRYRPIRICLTVLLAGALGNMIDRIRLGYVVDFLYIKLINFPVFNIADMYVTFSMAVLLILIIFKYNVEDFDVILGDKLLEEDGTYRAKRQMKPSDRKKATEKKASVSVQDGASNQDADSDKKKAVSDIEIEEID
jgi:signal peptidase II